MIIYMGSYVILILSLVIVINHFHFQHVFIYLLLFIYYVYIAPQARETHWKQTIFYINKTLTINKNEKITGHISCKRNEKNPRDLDIKISYNFAGKHTKASEELFYMLR